MFVYLDALKTWSSFGSWPTSVPTKGQLNLEDFFHSYLQILQKTLLS